MINYDTFLLNIFKNRVIWFNKDVDIQITENFFYTLRQSIKINIANRYIISSSIFITTWIDLTKTLDEIWKNFDKKSTQYEIRRAEKSQDDIKIFFTHSSQEIKEFLKIGEKYYTLKYGISRGLSLDDIVRKKNYILIKAIYKSEIICGNIYIYDEQRVRLNYSFSRYLEGEYYKTISTYMTRYLHRKAIIYFKEIGKTIYDFGGISYDQHSPTYGITKFKLSFGGSILEEYDYTLSRFGIFIKPIIHFSLFRYILGKIKFVKKMLYG